MKIKPKTEQKKNQGRALVNAVTNLPLPQERNFLESFSNRERINDRTAISGYFNIWRQTFKPLLNTE
jgi:hypothetical protein